MRFTIKRKRFVKLKNRLGGQEVLNPEKRKKVLLLLFIMILLAFILLLFNRLVNTRKTVIYQQQVLEEVYEPSDDSSEIAGKWYGLCEKNKIHSIEDFRRILERDPVLARHFSDFNFDKARMGKLEDSVWAHLAYRVKDRISTTRRVIRLREGDGYITDGRRWLRTYCCNDYVTGTESEKADAPEPLVDNLPRNVDGIPRFAVIPEPSTILLMGTGVSALGMMAYYRRRMRRLLIRKRRRRPVARS